MRQQKYKFRIFKFSQVLLDFSLEKIVKIRKNRIHFSFFCIRWRSYMNNLFVTSKNESTNSPIHEFRVLHKGRRAFYGIMVYYFVFITLKNHFKPCFFILKALKDSLQHSKFVNWWNGEFVVSLFLMSRTG